MSLFLLRDRLGLRGSMMRLPSVMGPVGRKSQFGARMYVGVIAAMMGLKYGMRGSSILYYIWGTDYCGGCNLERCSTRPKVILRCHDYEISQRIGGILLATLLRGVFQVRCGFYN